MTKKIENLEVKDVLKVYSGINGKCCCGCAGKYSYNPAYKVQGGKNRGYAVNEKECNLKEVNRILKKLKKVTEVQIGKTYISTVVGNRLYAVHLI